MKSNMNSRVFLAALMLSALYATNLAVAKTYFKETFSDNSWEKRWVQSEWKRDMGKWALGSGNWYVDKDIEQGLQTVQDAKFYAISAKLDKPFSNKGEDLVVQFSVKNVDKKSNFCGGGYIKLLPDTLNQEKFGGDSEYYIMFGPDICGYDVSRIHLIFNHKGKNLLKKEDIKLEYADKDELTHLYTLVVRPDNTYEVFFDEVSRAKGSLLEGWDFPQKTIGDPSDIKPDDWVDDETIADPNDKKPDNWDDIPKKIPDPDAEKPEDWDEEDDGKWEAPMIPNPDYKGEWKPKMIPNPDYKGRWIQKQIPNPDYQENVYAYENIGAVGFELWIVNKGSIFDNIYVGNSFDEANVFSQETWGKVESKQKKAKEEYDEKKKAEEKAQEEAERDETEDEDAEEDVSEIPDSEPEFVEEEEDMDTAKTEL